MNLGETYLRNETFTLESKAFGLFTVWQIAVLLIVLIFMWAIRRYLHTLAERLMDRLYPGQCSAARGTYRRFTAAYYGVSFVVLLVVGLIIGSQLYSGSDLKDKIYQLSDLWELFLGIVFVAVVMVLPNGIVGTWNRYWATRRIRRIEQALQKQKSAASNLIRRRRPLRCIHGYSAYS